METNEKNPPIVITFHDQLHNHKIVQEITWDANINDILQVVKSSCIALTFSEETVYDGMREMVEEHDEENEYNERNKRPDDINEIDVYDNFFVPDQGDCEISKRLDKKDEKIKDEDIDLEDVDEELIKKVADGIKEKDRSYNDFNIEIGDFFIKKGEIDDEHAPILVVQKILPKHLIQDSKYDTQQEDEDGYLYHMCRLMEGGEVERLGCLMDKNELEPILLTDEILEIHDLNHYGIYYKHNNFKIKPGYCIEIPTVDEDGDDTIIRRQVRYVNQLQQLLRETPLRGLASRLLLD